MRRELPPGYTIVIHPESKMRFVRQPKSLGGALIPNQGVNGYKTEADIVESFFVWYDRAYPR